MFDTFPICSSAIRPSDGVPMLCGSDTITWLDVLVYSDWALPPATVR